MKLYYAADVKVSAVEFHHDDRLIRFEAFHGVDMTLNGPYQDCAVSREIEKKIDDLHQRDRLMTCSSTYRPQSSLRIANASANSRKRE